MAESLLSKTKKASVDENLKTNEELMKVLMKHRVIVHDLEKSSRVVPEEQDAEDVKKIIKAIKNCEKVIHDVAMVGSSFTARLDRIADEIELVNPRLALAIDRISDRLDKDIRDYYWDDPLYKLLNKAWSALEKSPAEAKKILSSPEAENLLKNHGYFKNRTQDKKDFNSRVMEPLSKPDISKKDLDDIESKLGNFVTWVKEDIQGLGSPRPKW